MVTIQSMEQTVKDADVVLGFDRVRSIGSAVRVECARYRRNQAKLGIARNIVANAAIYFGSL